MPGERPDEEQSPHDPETRASEGSGTPTDRGSAPVAGPPRDARASEPPGGGLILLTGSECERLRYLAALLSEALPNAHWALPPEPHDRERQMTLALLHLRAGTLVIQLAETSHQVAEYRGLADRVGVRCLYVISTPPPPPREAEHAARARPAPARYVFVPSEASLTTQLEKVLAAWNLAGDTP